jgi:uncharacterized protein YjbJ (UPF0337 family)
MKRGMKRNDEEKSKNWPETTTGEVNEGAGKTSHGVQLETVGRVDQIKGSLKRAGK